MRFTGRKVGRWHLLIGRDNPIHRGALMTKLVLRFVNDDTAATAIEYGLIAAGISVAIIAVVNGLGTQLTSVFTSVSTQLGGGAS
jgi:pilus assembly protein Flp/PilA